MTRRAAPRHPGRTGRTGLRPVLALALAAAALPVLPGSPVAAPASAAALPGGCDVVARTPPGVPRPDGGPGVAGVSVYDRGTFVHQDYLYDDHGAGSPEGGPGGTVADSSATTAGTYLYPLDAPRFVNNAADLRQLRLRLDRGALVVEARLTSLADASTTAVSVALDTDSDRTRPLDFPHALGLRAAGADAVVTVRPGGADVTRGARTTALSGARADTVTDTLSVRVPLALLGAPGRWRVWAATGLWSGDAYAPVLPGAPTPTSPGGRRTPSDVRAFDVAFHPGETGADQWFDGKQAAALVSGDVSALAGIVDLGALRARYSRPWTPRPGFYEGVHTSSFTLPPLREGWDATTGFQGRHQPFGLYLPTAVTSGRPLALTVFAHGGTRNHTNLIGAPAMQTGFGERLGSVLVTPLARRGNETEYADDRMADVREVLAAVRTRFRTDPARQWFTGYSQGGNAVYRAIGLTPDEWGAAVGWAGQNPGSDPWLDSARWVPTLLLHTPADELVPYTESTDAKARFEELGYEHELHTHGGEHEYHAVTQEYAVAAAWLAARPVRRDPPRVTYARVPGEDETEYGLRFDRAYWLSGIVAAGERGVVDAISHGRGGTLPAVEEVLSTESGPPGPYVRDGLAYTGRGATVLPRENRLRLALSGIRGLTVDAARAGLDPARPLRLDVTSSAPSRVLLRGAPARLTVTGGGRGEAGRCGPVVVVPAGTSSVVVRPAR